MELQELTCPKCQGSLDLKIDDRKFIHCPYCGQMFSVDDGKREYTINQNININKNITHTQRTIDETEIIKAQLKAKKEKNNTLIGFISFAFCMLIVLLMTIIFPEDNTAVTEAIEAGKISAGASYEYEETDYEAVVKQLELLGFTNITAVDLKDTGLALWKNDKVVSVSIDGDTYFGSNDYFDPDAIIIIKHH